MSLVSLYHVTFIYFYVYLHGKISCLKHMFILMSMKCTLLSNKAFIYYV